MVYIGLVGGIQNAKEELRDWGSTVFWHGHQIRALCSASERADRGKTKFEAKLSKDNASTDNADQAGWWRAKVLCD